MPLIPRKDLRLGWVTACHRTCPRAGYVARKDTESRRTVQGRRRAARLGSSKGERVFVKGVPQAGTAVCRAVRDWGHGLETCHARVRRAIHSCPCRGRQRDCPVSPARLLETGYRRPSRGSCRALGDGALFRTENTQSRQNSHARDVSRELRDRVPKERQGESAHA